MGILTLVSPNYYSTLYQRFSNVRTVKFIKTHHTENQIKLYLHTHPELHLYTIIGNEPLLSAVDEEQVANGMSSRSGIVAKQQVKDENGENYIDEFGRYVYITSRIGTSPDEDLRYETGLADPELFTIQYTADDICDRKPNGTIC